MCPVPDAKLGIEGGMEKEKLLRICFLAAAFGTLLVVLLHILPPLSLSRPVRMLLIKQNGQLETLDTPEVRDFALKMRLPSIDFPAGGELVHRQIGPLGYKANFFLEFECDMNVKKMGNYTFAVASDDGFRLWIDDKMIGEFLGNRSIETNAYQVFLNPGKHTYRLKYYQGYGQLGLFAGYQFMDDAKLRSIGVGSSALFFE